MTLIERLRTKPPRERRLWAMGLAGLVMLFVIGIWLNSFKSHLVTQFGPEVAEVTTEITSLSDTVHQSVEANTDQTLAAAVGAQLAAIKNTFTSLFGGDFSGTIHYEREAAEDVQNRENMLE